MTESWMLIRCALCGDVFPVADRWGRYVLLACPCERRRPPKLPRKPSTVGVEVNAVLIDVASEVRARQAYAEEEP